MKPSSADYIEDKSMPPTRKTLSSGVLGVRDPKWIFVALCYIAAIAFMGLDPWYGDKLFTYNQGLFVGVLAILIVAGFCWESYLLGRPSGINLVLHCVLMVPVALLIGRIAGLPAAPETSYGFLGGLDPGCFSKPGNTIFDSFYRDCLHPAKSQSAVCVDRRGVFDPGHAVPGP
jgi:hypothetical protein